MQRSSQAKGLCEDFFNKIGHEIRFVSEKYKDKYSFPPPPPHKHPGDEDYEENEDSEDDDSDRKHKRRPEKEQGDQGKLQFTSTGKSVAGKGQVLEVGGILSLEKQGGAQT